MARVYGVAEIAEALNVRRQTVWAWVQRGTHGIPEPDQRLAMGPVWRAETIEPWIRKMDRIMADNLLVRDYNDMTMEERARSIEEARRVGWECAQAYASAHDDDLGSLVVEPRDYIQYIVQVAYATEQCSEATLHSWEQASDEELEADPRVQAFMRAWAETPAATKKIRDLPDAFAEIWACPECEHPVEIQYDQDEADCPGCGVRFEIPV